LGDREGLAATLNGLAGDDFHARDYGNARLRSLEARAIHRGLGDRRGEGFCALRLGFIHLRQGETAEAHGYFEQAQELSLPAEDERLRIFALGGLGRVALRRHDAEEARAHFRRCLELCRKTGERSYAASALEGLAQQALLRDDRERAAVLLGAGAALRARLNVPGVPQDREDTERLTRSVRDAVTPDAFDAAWASGGSLSWDEAIELGLGG
jgi:tetratricopeptide (TPR) repeat protein